MVKQFQESYFPGDLDRIKTFCENQSYSGLTSSLRIIAMTGTKIIESLSDSAWNTFRDHLILEYEIPKYDGDLGNPNLFVPLSPAICRRKTRYLDQTFRSQKGRHWFSEDTFLALMRLRGVECASKYAEAFYCRKMICG